MKIIKTIQDNDIETIHKISFQIYSYHNNKLLTISEDEMFVTQNYSDETSKYKNYINTNTKQYNKKIGNLSFNFGFKTEELYEKEIFQTKDKIFNYFSVKKNLNNKLE